MEYIRTKILTQDQKEELRALWNKEYPRLLKHESLESLEEYLSPLEDKNYILLLNERQGVKGWLCDFMREGERQFFMALDVSIQGKGYGSQILRMTKEQHNSLSAWVIKTTVTYQKENGELYSSPISFYLKNDFAVLPHVSSLSARLEVVRIRWTTNEK